MSFATTRAIMAKLEIDDWNYDDTRLEFPINHWLAENNRLDALAGAIAHPKSDAIEEDGMLLMTRFIRRDHDSGSAITIEERKEDISVKDWLTQEGGANENDLEWLSLWDRFGLTRCGLIPLRQRDRPLKITRVKVPPDQVRRWSEYNRDSKSGELQNRMSLGEFVQKEAAEAAYK